MKYYKIIKDNTIIGVVNSNSFIRYQTVNQVFIGANETTGDFVEYDNKTYRSLWMKPLTQEFTLHYEIIELLEIDREEYNTLLEALQKNEIIAHEDEEYEELLPVDPGLIPDNSSIEFIRQSKINEMSYICRQTIEAGFDLEFHDGIRHFSLTTQDQLNLMSLNVLAQTQDLIPYHADGEECIFYTSDEINLIVETATNLKIYQTTYYNSLKNYINALETIEEIAAIEYGTPIPDNYKSDALRIIEM